MGLNFIPDAAHFVRDVAYLVEKTVPHFLFKLLCDHILNLFTVEFPLEKLGHLGLLFDGRLLQHEVNPIVVACSLVVVEL